MAPLRSVVRRGEYYDSVLLMRVSEEVRRAPGVKEAAVLMATDTNKRMLSDVGLLTEDVKRAGADDLVIVVEAIDDESAGKAILRADELL
ncbi:TPA: hypothetical protein EYP44_01155, partial [Candidatus Bathyarchaeota archaeon]|nr:hypothetical protein [Candidatus Bathyarchaeota archaeon]